MESKLVIKIMCCIGTDSYKLETNVKKSILKDLLGNVVRSKVGAGKDDSKPNERDEYTIGIEIDLSDDLITTSSNCGNKGLETGIILAVFRRMNEQGEIE